MKRYQSIIFDFDSTLVTIEGINELARRKGKFQEVSRLTDLAMNGTHSFQDIFYRRLQVVRPTIKDLAYLSDLYQKNLTTGAEFTVKQCISQGMSVYVISGGYEQAILPTTRNLGIPDHHVFTIRLEPDDHGVYTKVGHLEELIKDDGKFQVVSQLNPARKSIFIGDGHTDLATKNAVDYFIGFGGITIRQSVKSQADYYLTTQSLEPVYNLITR